jgi:hypothetical protein
MYSYTIEKWLVVATVIIIAMLLITVSACDVRNIKFYKEMAEKGHCWEAAPSTPNTNFAWRPCSNRAATIEGK